MKQKALKNISITFGLLSLIYWLIYFKKYEITYFIQDTIGLGIVMGAFISFLTLYLLSKLKQTKEHKK